MVDTMQKFDVMIFQVVLLCVGMINVQCLPKHTYTANFDLHITEKGALFDQNIETDIINDVIYYHTPAHNDLNEMYKMQDFKKDIEVSCYPSKHECYKSYLDRTVYLDATNTTESLLKGYKLNGNQLSSDKPTSVYNKKWYKKALIEDLNLLGSTSAKEFVNDCGFPLYEVALIPDNAQFIETKITSGHKLKRRFVPVPTDCANNAAPEVKYAYTDTQGCDWLYVCDATVSPDDIHQGAAVSGCQQSHVRDRQYWSCLCCPEENTLSECFCSKLGAPQG